MKLFYCIEVIEDIIVSQSPATATTHSSLDFIPGSAILGAIAAQSYSSFGEKSWDIFHNSKVKFSNCYVANQHKDSISSCYPTPLSWHIPKGEFLYTNNKLNLNLKNHAHIDYTRDDGVQEKQCRTGYISTKGKKVSVNQSSVTKTAINAATQTVEEAQLFSYNFIEQDQLLIGFIEADTATINEIRPYLENISQIGRSRNSEFGEVAIHILPGSNQIHLNKGVKSGEHIILWLISDCQILDSNGFPCLLPTASLIGLNNAELDLTRSFINCNTTTLFNRKRKRFDSSQSVIKKGSVLVYKALDDMSHSALQSLQDNGIGINQQIGHGQIIINPEWSKNVSFDNSQLFAVEDFSYSSQKKVSTHKPETALCNWIDEKVTNDTSYIQRNNTANEAFIKILNFYIAGRQFNSIDESFSAGPNKTQWGLLYQLYRGEENENQAKEFKNIITINSTDKHNWDLALMNADITTFSTEFERVFTGIEETKSKLLLLEKLKSSELDMLGVSALNKLKSKIEGELS